MTKKRVIFSLLYDSGQFVLSRNFRLQVVGDVFWLKENYNFAKISHAIDELIILDVSRSPEGSVGFIRDVELIVAECFIPISLGGKINSVERAHEFLRAGADKVVINSGIHRQRSLISELCSEFGQQCIIASVDVKKIGQNYKVMIDQGATPVVNPAIEILLQISELEVGEIYLNSMDRDGTGQGYDIDLLELIPADVPVSVILAGGAGNWKHLHEGLMDTRVDAVATANLFNFIGNGLLSSRNQLIEAGIDLAVWNANELSSMRGSLND